MARLIGIDLGTTNSAAAMLEGGVPRMVLNDTGSTITPSAIWETPSGELVVGALAYKKAGSATRFKRRMGTADRIRMGTRELMPEDCSSLIVRKLAADASAFCREDVSGAVITVPANWKDGPRRATETAGRLAGLKVERLINEPTAAAMAYGIREDADGKTVAVYDLGGGTFDVTILRISQKVFDVITSCGDDRLGGADFDAALLSHVIDRLHQRGSYRLPPAEAREPKLEQRLRELELACEEAKKELSFSPETTISFPFLDAHGGEPVGIEERITRRDLEQMIDSSVVRTIGYMESALRQGKIRREEIDDIVLVGGSTRIPAVRQRVAEFFGKEPLTSVVNPDEAIALGAAIQAGIIAQDHVTEQDFVALDNVNSSLGVEVVSLINDRLVPGVFSPIIPRDTKLPAKKTCSYSTVQDQQTSIEIRCYEGDSPVAAQNSFLPPPICVENLPPRPAGETDIEITFAYDVSQILQVEFEVRDTPIRGSHQIAMRSGNLSEAEFGEKRQKLESLWQSSSLAGHYRSLIARAERTLAERPALSARTELAKAVTTLKQAIAEGQAERAEALDLQLTDILFELE